jgi:superfamily I DNA and/or RNA helicase
MSPDADADAVARARIEEVTRLWRAERAATRRRFEETRAALPPNERVARGVALRGLTVDETDAAPGGRVQLWLALAGGAPLPDTRFGPGDPVVLWHERPDAEDAVYGVVSRKARGRLGVMTDTEPPEWMEETSIRVDASAPESTFDLGDRALSELASAAVSSTGGWFRRILFGDAPPSPAIVEPLDPYDGGLDPAQRAAVQHALGSPDVALIHGPPGTGKTRTLVEVVRQAVAAGERVLCCAASNMAVDNLAERLLETGESVVRLGHPARVAPAVEAHSLDALLRQSDAWGLARDWLREANELRSRAESRLARGRINRSEARAMRQEAGRLMRDARRHLAGVQSALLSGAQIVCATAAGADALLLKEGRFDRVVLDEATQAVDPIALVALSRGGRAVLAGDPHQLPPTVIDPRAARAGLRETFFERIAAAHPSACRMLIVQHRMNDALMAWPSASMYGQRLVAAASVARHQLADLPGVAPDPDRQGALFFVDTAGRGWDELEGSEVDPSLSNPGQAERTADEVRRLFARGLPLPDIAVITPYDAQVRLLRQLLAAEVSEGLEIRTVDGFQGREKEAVVVDLVRSNPDGRLGFLEDTRRMNVAVTRARRYLVVIGDSATLGAHPYYAGFLESVESAGGWLSAWAD